jgi:hypothetical protein
MKKLIALLALCLGLAIVGGYAIARAQQPQFCAVPK